jgi:hypothetical protein
MFVLCKVGDHPCQCGNNHQRYCRNLPCGRPQRTNCIAYPPNSPRQRKRAWKEVCMYTRYTTFRSSLHNYFFQEFCISILSLIIARYLVLRPMWLECQSINSQVWPRPWNSLAWLSSAQSWLTSTGSHAVDSGNGRAKIKDAEWDRYPSSDMSHLCGPSGTKWSLPHQTNQACGRHHQKRQMISRLARKRKGLVRNLRMRPRKWGSHVKKTNHSDYGMTLLEEGFWAD